MKYTIQVNNKNNIGHMIYLDEHIPLKINKLPENVAYKVADMSILATTTQTLKNTHLDELRQKNKQIIKPTEMIIVKNTAYTPTIQIKTIKENPMINVHTCRQNTIIKTLKRLLKKHSPSDKAIITRKRYSLYCDDKKIYTYPNIEYLEMIKETLKKNTTMTLQEAQYRVQQEYYKYISIDKINQCFRMILNKKSLANSKKLSNVIDERTLMTTTNQQEQDKSLSYYLHLNPEEKLPPTPWDNPLYNLKKNHKKYPSKYNTRHNNPDTVIQINKKKIQPQRIRNMARLDRNILDMGGYYKIRKKHNNKTQVIYRTKNKNKARYMRDKLEKHKYSKKNIQKYQRRYFKEKKAYTEKINERYKVLDYYTHTKNKLTRKEDIKEQYQQQQIQYHNRNPINIQDDAQITYKEIREVAVRQ